MYREEKEIRKRERGKVKRERRGKRAEGQVRNESGKGNGKASYIIVNVAYPQYV